MQVKLKKDLTKYHATLVPGVIGEVVGVYGEHSRSFPKVFVGVKFPKHTLDVMWDQLEVLREAPRPKMGPQIERQFDTPPKRGQVVRLGGVEFQVDTIERQVDDTTWIVNVIAL
jgi:hypothetical protein